MTRGDDSFGAWRSILQGAPNAARWAELVRLLGDDITSADIERVELWLPYAQDHLARWPDALRTLPGAWRKRPRHPGRTLVRSLDLSRLPEADMRGVLGWLDGLELRHIRGARDALRRSPGEDDVARWPLTALLQHPACAQLEHLDLSWCNLGSGALRHTIERDALPRTLRSVSLDGNPFLGPSHLGVFLREGRLTELETLSLRHLRLDGLLTPDALAQWDMPNLRHLSTVGSVGVPDGLTRFFPRTLQFDASWASIGVHPELAPWLGVYVLEQYLGDPDTAGCVVLWINAEGEPQLAIWYDDEYYHGRTTIREHGTLTLEGVGADVVHGHITQSEGTSWRWLMGYADMDTEEVWSDGDFWIELFIHEDGRRSLRWDDETFRRRETNTLPIFHRPIPDAHDALRAFGITAHTAT